MKHFQAGVERGRLWSSWECLLPGYLGLARLHAVQQNWQAAFDDLAELRANTVENLGVVQASVESFRALLNLWSGDLPAAARWADDFEPERPRDYLLAWERDALVRCRIWIALGEAKKAEKLLVRIIGDARQAGRNRHWLEAMCLRVVLLDLNRRQAEALDELRLVLEFAEPQGYVRLFVEEGEPMQKVLRSAATKWEADQRLGAYLGKLLATFETPARIPHQAEGLVEPLSERELEVLNYIAEGLSNPEIARRLYLSPNTLKAHSQNIFMKLNVHNRVQAVNKAKELDLIE